MKNSHSPKNRKVAVFDIDGTIFRSSLIIELFNELVRRGIYPLSASRVVEKNYLAWLNRKGPYNVYLMKLVHIFYAHIGGCQVRRIEPAIRSVIARQKDRTHRYPRKLIEELRRRGYFILAISNSPEPLVRRFAQMMKFDAAIGHSLEVINGVYTGNSISYGMLAPGVAKMDKVRMLNSFAEDRHIHIAYRQSVMIGDTEGDIPLLSVVGHPIAFNPSLPLARLARRKGWRIIVERKDVIYDIRDAAFIPADGTTI